MSDGPWRVANHPPVRFKRLHPDAILPTRATPGSAGLDLHACIPSGFLIPRTGRLSIHTGWSVAIPHGYEGQIRPRSGLALRHGLTVLNSPATIDADYRGELRVMLVNLGDEAMAIGPGDRIAQLVIAPVAMADAVEVEGLPPTERGGGGFGSTGA